MTPHPSDKPAKTHKLALKNVGRARTQEASTLRITQSAWAKMAYTRGMGAVSFAWFLSYVDNPDP